MNESAQSDATSDSDFDEHEVAVEDDEDSIAPEEDVADEEEVNSLVKESQMSLEDLLASYGVPTSSLNLNTLSGKSSNVVGRPSHRRPPAVGVTSNDPVTSANPSVEFGSRPADLSGSLLTSSAVKRSRRSNTSPSFGFVHTTDRDHDHEPTKRRFTDVSTDQAKEAVGQHSGNPIPEQHESRDDTRKQSLSMGSSSETTSPVVITSGSNETHSPHRTSRRRAGNVNNSIDKSSVISESQDSNSAPADSVPTVIPCGPATSDESTHGSRTTSVHIPDTSSEQNSKQALSGVEPLSHESNCEDSPDNVRDENYPSRFWQRAIGGGESPPSYDSDEDEDYAPSVESGHDWRGEIHVGDDYQAMVPPFQPHFSNDWWDTGRFEVESSLLWQPSKIPEQDVVRFERLFAQSVIFPLPSERTVDDEEALFTLMRCNYDPDEALQRLRFRTVSPAEIPGYLETWSKADAAAFEKGFALYGKDFKQIRDTRLRHKTVGELVHYYYLWKKSARHDEFARAYRRDKRKSPHPSMTDFMDCLVLEQEAVAEAYMTHLSDSGVGSFHIVNRLSSGHHIPVSKNEPLHDASCSSRYLSHPDPHVLASQPISTVSIDENQTTDKSLFSSTVHSYFDAASPASAITNKENTSSGNSAPFKPADTTGRSSRATSVSV